MKKKTGRMIGMALGILLLTGCGGRQVEETAGYVTADGSTSMEKVIGVLGESFEELHPEIRFTYNPTGSGSGITAVAEGRCDIGLSSRSLSEEERNKGLRETVLAYDGIAVIVHPDNPLSDMTIEQLAAVFTGEIQNWSEIGGADGEIVLIGREAGSGTRDGFENITKTAGSCRYRQELTSTGDVITTVAANPHAIGYASLASLKGQVKAVCINGIAPNAQSLRDGSYAVQRPFILVTREKAEISPAAQAFFDYIQSENAREIISGTGVVPAD